MTIKISTPNISNLTSGAGPSKAYYETQSRFQSILQTKLGAGGTTNSLRASENPMLFDASNVNVISGVSPEILNQKFKGTAFEGLGNAFTDAEKKYGINAWFLSGLAIHESDYGNSRIAQDKNNLFGFMAYDASPYKSAARYGSKNESIDAVAKYLSEEYTSPEGKYYNGSSVEAIGKRYATDPKWAEGIKKRIEVLMK